MQVRTRASRTPTTRVCRLGYNTSMTLNPRPCRGLCVSGVHRVIVYPTRTRHPPRTRPSHEDLLPSPDSNETQNTERKRERSNKSHLHIVVNVHIQALQPVQHWQ